jgi:hypothetical protein
MGAGHALLLRHTGNTVIAGVEDFHSARDFDGKAAIFSEYRIAHVVFRTGRGWRAEIG